MMQNTLLKFYDLEREIDSDHTTYISTKLGLKTKFTLHPILLSVYIW